MRYFLIASVITLLSCSAAQENAFQAPDAWPSRAVLMDNFRKSDTAIIVFAKEDHAIADLLISTMAAAQEQTDRMRFILRRDDEITEHEVTHFPLYIIGTREHLLLRRLSGNIPAEFTDAGFIFNGTNYFMPNDLLKIAFFPNVYQPSLPVSLVYGNREEVIVEFIQKELRNDWGYFFWDPWGYQVYHNGKRALLGNFSDSAETRWEVTDEQRWQFDHEGVGVFMGKFANYIAHNNASDTSVADYNANLETGLGKLVQYFEIKDFERFTIHFYPNEAEKTMMFNDGEQSLIDAKNDAVHTVMDGVFHKHFDEKPATLFLQNNLGQANYRALAEGFAVYFTENWQDTDPNMLALRLLRANALPTLEELLRDDAFESESDLLMHIAACSWVSYLVKKESGVYWKNNYADWTAPKDLRTMESEWHQHIRETPVTDQRVRTKPLPEQMHGFNFGHEGYEVFNGYMGSEAEKSIAKLRDLGCNVISIIPYSIFRSMEKPMRLPYTQGAGAENDVAVVHAAYEAQQNGMQVMLKPQLWSWLGWTGNIKMQNEADWNAFFRYYKEWIMHYALLAEIYSMEMFCVGNEFEEATLSRHAQWNDIFSAVREVYSGYTTYAANWGKEIEQGDFSGDLDFLSVNWYYPLSAVENPTDEQLRAAFEENLNTVENIASKFGKPLLITEIGYKSIAYPWKQPHKDADEQEYSEAAQKKCYEVMRDILSERQSVRGVFIWKWPSYMGFAQDYPKDFNPCGKEAEAVVADWFLKK